MKWVMWALCVMTGITGSGEVASADFLSGNTLYNQCQTDYTPNAGLATFYIMGSIDSIWRAQHFYKIENICIPHHVLSQQVRDVVCQKLAQHPEERDNVASDLIYKYLSQAFPCQNGAAQ